MQQLSLELNNTPRDASQVPCSVNCELNKEETLSVHGIVLDDNNPDVNLSELNRKQNTSVSVKVYVLNMRGNPLMPCSPRKAKILLKQGKARVIKRSPFTIQLTKATGETKQEVVLGVDTGHSNVGVSAISDKEELLSATFKLRTNISDLSSVPKTLPFRGGMKGTKYFKFFEKCNFFLTFDTIYNIFF